MQRTLYFLLAALLALGPISTARAEMAGPAAVGDILGLETGIYTATAGNCDEEFELREQGIDQIRLIVGDSINFGYHMSCVPARATNVPGGTRFNGSCQESQDSFDTDWVLKRHSPRSFTEIRGVYEGTGGLRFTKCADDSALREQWKAWFPKPATDPEAADAAKDRPAIPRVPTGFEIGPSAVLSPGIDPIECSSARYDEGVEAWYRCLRGLGASEDALRFARLTEDEALLERLHQHGTVDVGNVVLPFLANTNWQQAFISGGRIVWPGQFIVAGKPRDAGSRRVLRRFPQAFPSGRIGIGAYRRLPGGVERFVLTDVLNDGCRACEVAGVYVGFVEFRDGQPLRHERLGWVKEDDGLSDEAVAARIASGDIAALQRALNLGGYDAGPMDGARGRRTNNALAEFQTEFCLAPGSALSLEQARVLVAANRSDGAAPDCGATTTAPGAGDFPYPSGTYVADPGLCGVGADARYAELGEAAYALSILVEGGRIRYGDGMDCQVRQVSDLGGSYTVQMACMGEGTPQPDQIWTIAKRSDTSFEKTGRLFSLCPDTGALVATPEGTGTEATEAALSLTRTQRREIQRRLKLLGHDPGGVDGVLGARSREAIAGWQSAHGLDASGYLNASHLAALNAESEALYSEWKKTVPSAPRGTWKKRVCTWVGPIKVCSIR